ncbi:MAG: hypothetical protein IT165_23090 [Bryobacterales bacterium]|nr:hypothetical protein [Bryobacterales bacterium]
MRRLVRIADTPRDSLKGGSLVPPVPQLFAVTDGNLKTVGNGGSAGKADGTDILFTVADGVTKLDHELERYNAATGEVAAWVQISALSPAFTSTTAMLRRRSSRTRRRCGARIQGRVAPWGERGEHDGADSSGTGNTGTNQANTNAKTAARKVGNGLTFNGSSDWVSIASIASLGSGLGSFTISARVKKSSNSSVDVIVWHGHDSDGSGGSYRSS